MAGKTLGIALLAVIASWLVSWRVAAAPPQAIYDSALYTSLVPAGSAETIAPGTKITVQNWQQYRRFMPVGLQALYSGKYFWRVGGGPDYTITVGPTIPMTLNKQFVRDTERYGTQSRLEKVDTGGYELTGYVAGLPFPHPTEPELATKVMYNARYVYFAAVTEGKSTDFLIDRFLNVTSATSEGTGWRLSHLSTPGKPTNPPYAKGFLAAGRSMLTSPEEARYLTSLSLEPDDLSVPQEFWTFLPSFRRPLRLSSAARCAPQFGSDLVNDDQGDGLFFLPANFKATFLGEHKILAFFHGSTDPAVRFNTGNVIIAGSVPGWSKPVLGQWELRDMYVIDITPLPVMGHYCYGHKVLYVDKEVWFAFPDIYDADSRLWKTGVGALTLFPDNNGEGDIIPVINHFAFLDLQNGHATLVVTTELRLDNDAPADIQDPEVAAFPSALMNILK